MFQLVEPGVLPKAGALDLLAEICALHRNDAAHLMQPGTHAITDSIAQRLSLRRIFGGFRASAAYVAQALAFGEIRVVRCDDCRAIVVIPSVQDEAYRIPYPICGLDRAEFVQRQDLGLEYGPKHVQFCRFDGIVVRVLYLLQQLSVIVEQTRNPFAKDKFLNNPDRQMGLAYTNRADQQQTGLIDWVLFHELAGSHTSWSQRTMQTVEFKSPEFAMFVTCWYACGR